MEGLRQNEVQEVYKPNYLLLTNKKRTIEELQSGL